MVYSCKPEECQDRGQINASAYQLPSRHVWHSGARTWIWPASQLLLWSLSAQYFLYQETISSDFQWVCSCKGHAADYVAFIFFFILWLTICGWGGAELFRAQDNFQMLFFLGLHQGIACRLYKVPALKHAHNEIQWLKALDGSWRRHSHCHALSWHHSWKVLEIWWDVFLTTYFRCS